ncbi:hypothetical protein [Xylanimonas cellulosilytica]|nr:hypothetical protein [Xylanimonas cellulosilytica]
MARYYDDEASSDVFRSVLPTLASLITAEYAADMAESGEWQEAVEFYLVVAARENIAVPADVIDQVRTVGADLIPAGLTVAQAA